MRNNRLAGHTIPSEGRIKNAHGIWIAVGSIRCSCGEESGVLASDNARKRWHFQHKAQIRAAQEDAATEAGPDSPEEN